MTINYSTLSNTVKSSFFTNGDSHPTICFLHETFQVEDNTSHCCLACNFANTVTAIEDVAKIIANIEDEATANTTYLLWLYLLCERMQEVLNLLSIPEEIKVDKFKTLLLIKRWANFIKHPKAYFLAHHCSKDQTQQEVTIDDTFINRYYSGGKHNAVLYQTITNTSNIKVTFPDLHKLTKQLADELNTLQNIINLNPIYQELLQNKVVLQNYFSNDNIDE